MSIEILKLKEMLEVENIPFEFIEDVEVQGYQIGYPKLPETDECICSVLQNKYSHGNKANLLEIWEISKRCEPEGYLSAEEVLDKIKEYYKVGAVDENDIK